MKEENNELSGLERTVERSVAVSDGNQVSGLERFYNKGKNALTNYAVDVSGSLLFFNPILIAGEYAIAGMSPEQILASRTVGSMAQAMSMRFGGMLRNDVCKNSNIVEESPWYQKKAASVLSTLAFQIPIYTSILCNPEMGASEEQAYKALAQGIGITLVSGYHYGKWQDKWRKFWGKEQAIKK